MKNYTITVNGIAYDVTVEEKAAGSAPVQRAAAPVAPVAAAAAPAASAPAAGGAGSIKVEAGAAGKVFKIEAKVGQAMKAGDTVIILEAMKMEIPVVAPKDGTVVSIDVTEGQNVDAGQVMATLD
ncbi:MAG: biotin/lipoyl-binding protein [Lachnospiraceae bacterium]|jgi:biotin carboxyl carrier protein|nr:biotin/lipoyl-binding protein [Lachnospiraceae bacterium]